MHQLCPLAGLDGVIGAAFCALDGYASPEAVVQGYAAGARRHGATVTTRAPVTGIEVRDGEIEAVTHGRGTIETNVVVCAAGVWSPEIAGPLGIELPVEPYLREVGFTGPVADLPERMPLTVDFSTGLYFHREGPGLLFGMADRAQPPGFDAPTDGSWLEKVMEVAERRLPSLLDMGLAGGWKGYYEVTPDHNALVGESPERRALPLRDGLLGTRLPAGSRRRRDRARPRTRPRALCGARPPRGRAVRKRDASPRAQRDLTRVRPPAGSTRLVPSSGS